MSSPTFNGNKIFDSIKADESTISEGKLIVRPYSPITQRIHFDGEIGDYTLWHGYPDTQWTFTGIISATNSGDWKSIITGIQSAVDDGALGNYRTLTDSFGNYYHNAQIRSWDYTFDPHVQAENSGTNTIGWVASIVVNGIIQNANTQWGATS